MTDLATLYEILDGPMDNRSPPQWAIDKVSSLPDVVKLQTIYVHAKLINAIAALLVQERELARSEIFEWLRNNMTFYNTGEADRPVLADVSKRIWYHATDSMALPFNKLIALGSDVPATEYEFQPVKPPEET